MSLNNFQVWSFMVFRDRCNSPARAYTRRLYTVGSRSSSSTSKDNRSRNHSQCGHRGATRIIMRLDDDITQSITQQIRANGGKTDTSKDPTGAERHLLFTPQDLELERHILKVCDSFLRWRDLPWAFHIPDRPHRAPRMKSPPSQNGLTLVASLMQQCSSSQDVPHSDICCM